MQNAAGGPAAEGDFEREIERGSLYVGSPETVAAKIVDTVQTLGLNRFDLKYGAGQLSHELLLNSIELYGTKVAPLVRQQLGGSV